MVDISGMEDIPRDISNAEIGEYSEDSAGEDGFSLVQDEEESIQNFQWNEFTDDAATSTDDESRPASAVSKTLEKVGSSEKFIEGGVRMGREMSAPGRSEFGPDGALFDSGMRVEDQLSIPPASHLKQGEGPLNNQDHELEDREFYDHHVDEEEPHPLSQSHQALNQPHPFTVPRPLNQPHPLPQLQSLSHQYPLTQHPPSSQPRPFQPYPLAQQPPLNPPSRKQGQQSTAQTLLSSPFPPPPSETAPSHVPPEPTHHLAQSPPGPATSGNYSLEQLQVLNLAKSRQMDELKRQLSAQKEDSERHVTVLREECGRLERKKNELETLVEELDKGKGDVETQLVSVKAELEVEATRNVALEASKNELMARLVSAEATMSSLKQQVVELGSSEALARVRESYSTAMAQAEDKHRQQLAQAMADMQRVREDMEAKDDTIQRLNQDLDELRRLHEDHTHPHTGSCAENSAKDGIVQQLKFESERKKGRVVGQEEEEDEEGEEDRRKRLVQLATQAEDLSYQVSTLTEELEYKQKQMETTEDQLSLLSTQLSGAQGEIGILNAQVSGLQRRLETVQVNAESEKRQAMEQCRMACQRLQEDSMQRLRQSFTAEMEKMSQDYTRQLAQARDDLTSFKEKYVAICGEKEVVMAEKEAASREVDVIKGTLEKVKVQLLEAEQEHVLQERKLQGEVVRLMAMLAQESRLEHMSRDKEETGHVVTREYEKLGEEVEERKRELESVKKDIERKREELEAVEGKLLAASVELESVQKLNKAKSAGLESVTVELEMKSAELKVSVERIEEKNEELESLKKEIESRSVNLESVRRLVATASAELEALRKEIGRAEQEGAESKEKEASANRRIEEEAERWRSEVEKARTETDRVRTQMELEHKEALERVRREEVLVSANRAVEEARVLWLKERDQLVQSHLGDALGAARKAWLRERDQLVQQQVEATLKAARSSWIKERDELMREQIIVAVASAEKSWEQHQHRRGRTSNLDPLKTEQLQQVLEEAESRYKVALQSAREELCSRHIREKEALMLQLRQLEGRLGRVLKEREQEVEHRSEGCSCWCGRGKPELMEARVQQVLEQWKVNMTSSVRMLVDEVEKKLEKHYEKRLEEVREEAAAEKAKKQQQLHWVSGQPPVAMSWSDPATSDTSPREAKQDRHATVGDRGSGGSRSSVGDRGSGGGRGTAKVKPSIKDKRSQAKIKR